MLDWLIKARVENNYSRNQLAQEVGVDRTYIYKIEMGDRKPSPELAQALGEVLGFNWTIFYEQQATCTSNAS